MKNDQEVRSRVELRDRKVIWFVIETARISERELARQAGLSHATVNHLLSGRRGTCSAKTGQAIEEALHLSKGALFRAFS